MLRLIAIGRRYLITKRLDLSGGPMTKVCTNLLAIKMEIQFVIILEPS